MPVGADRQALEGRRGELAHGLQPGERAAMARAVIAMFTAYPSVRLDEEGAALTASTYVGQVQTFPLWAVEKGCATLIARNNPFPPSAGELRAAVDSTVRDARSEFYELRDILDAQVYRLPGAAETARRKAMADKIREDLALSKPIETPRRSTGDKPTYAPSNAGQDAAQEWLAEASAEPRSLPPISDALRKSLGLTQELDQ